MSSMASKNAGLGRTGLDSHGQPTALTPLSQKDKAWALVLTAIAVLLGLIIWAPIP